MSDKVKGYIALGVAVYLAGRVAAIYYAKEKMLSDGRLLPDQQKEQEFNQATAGSLIIPGLVAWYGFSRLRAA